MSRRRWLAPEVIQTSAMDCGPAALKAALDGFGVSVHLGRLREACQTEVDGTSISTLEALATSMGMSPRQTLCPPEHLGVDEAVSLPAVLVVSRPDGALHFVLLWRKVGQWAQIMDPSSGRRWVRFSRLKQELYVHVMQAHEGLAARWLQGRAVLGGLAARLLVLGVPEESLDELVGEGHPARITALDWATRRVEALRQAGVVASGEEARRLVVSLAARAEVDRPGEFRREGWSAWRAWDGPATWQISGAVVLCLSAPTTLARSDLGAAAASRPEALTRALEAPPERPLRALLLLVREVAPWLPWQLLLATAAGALGGVVEALLLRALIDLGLTLRTPAQRGLGVAALVGLMALNLALGLGLAALLQRAGRRLELRLRLLFHQKLPRIADRYFSSRLPSDLAERAHAIAALRGVPTVLGGAMGMVMALAAVTAGVATLDPSALGPALFAALVAIVAPLIIHPWLASRELRRQTFDGTLARSYLDAMLGAIPLRAHRAEESLRREHESLLTQWLQAGEDALRASILAGLAQGALGLVLAAWLVLGHLQRAEQAGAALLLVFWATQLPALGRGLAASTRTLPALQSVAARVMEPLDAPEEGGEDGPPPPEWASGALGVQLEGVTVRAGGALVLADVNLKLSPGEHVAVVGPSGAGKSSLVGLLLGWHSPNAGTIVVNGVPLNAARLPALRRRVAWVDPAVQLWRGSLVDNLRYGHEDSELDLGALLQEAELEGVLAELPEGLGSPLGEGGGLLSGGQGQRVRLGRALGRPDVGLALLDEAFRGLDRGRRRALTEAARARWASATLVCVTHDVADAGRFPRVIVIDGGRVVQDGPPEALLGDTEGLYARLVAEEQVVLAALEGGADWRRWRIEAGRLVEEGR
jgi:ABC-type bacteriocin/lantibiotic exporter with double-glycine peptidase domain